MTDRETPFVRWIEGMVRRLVSEHGDKEAVEFALPAFSEKAAPELLNYPFPHVVWQPLQLTTGETFAGLLVTREKPWSEQDRKVIGREAGVFGNAWQALHGSRTMQRRRWFGRRGLAAVAALAGVAAFVPVPMTTLAPVEIIAKRPQRVTAPIDGVIKEILVDPNRPVSVGQLILRFDETTLRNRLQLAEREVLLARSHFETVSQAAFADDKARHEVAQAEAEWELKKAELDYASELLARSEIRAQRQGVLVYSDRDHWIGRPVKTGERIMQIVGTGEMLARIEVPVADAIVLERSAKVRMFLDANPLTAVPARIVSEAYHAEPNGTQSLVYRLDAEIGGDTAGLRIGARGTAQLHGDTVPLIFFLLRRPISSLRQHLGV